MQILFLLALVVPAVLSRSSHTVETPCVETTTEHCFDEPEVKYVPVEVEHCKIVTKVICEQGEHLQLSAPLPPSALLLHFAPLPPSAPLVIPLPLPEPASAVSPIETQICTPVAEEQCNTVTVMTEEITYKKRCKVSTSKNCSPIRRVLTPVSAEVRRKLGHQE